MEQKTPARGHSFGLPRFSMAPSSARAASQGNSPAVALARDIAQNVASILPEAFDRVMPRGYSASGQGLVMARFEIAGSRGQALYARDSNWGEKESGVFLRDLKDGWLDELASYMRWQLRADPVANAVFQHALVHLTEDVKRRLLISPNN